MPIIEYTGEIQATYFPYIPHPTQRILNDPELFRIYYTWYCYQLDEYHRAKTPSYKSKNKFDKQKLDEDLKRLFSLD